MSYNYVTVSGTFATLTGTVTFTPPNDVTDLTGTIPVLGPGPFSCTVSGGSFTSAALLATDNVGLLPAGWTWLATVALTGKKAYTYPVLIPAANGTTATLSSLAVSASGGGSAEGFNNPMTTLGDTISGGASGAAARVAGNTSGTKNFLTQTGTGSASAAPAWGTIATGDVPGTLNATTFAGTVTPSAGIAPVTSGFTAFGTGGVTNVLNSTAGASGTTAAGTFYYAALYVPFNCTLTGIQAVTGTTGGTDNWIVALWPAAGGTALATSSLTGVVAPASNTKKSFPFTATVPVNGPGVYIAGVQSNGTHATYLAFSNAVEGFVTGGTASGFGTVPSLTPASTYTANLGPFMSTY